MQDRCGPIRGQQLSQQTQSASADKTKAGWKRAAWEKQGLTFTLPPDWRLDESLPETEEKLGTFFTSSSISWKGSKEQALEVSIETGAGDFPLAAEEMLEKDFEIDQKLKQDGKVPIGELRYMEVDGLKGEYFTEGAEDDPKAKLSWITYRHYKGKAQHLFIRLSGPKKDLETLTSILNSTKVSRD